ncbi:MAG: phosphatidate cytidylyltransferase [Eubacteriales bacterium]
MIVRLLSAAVFMLVVLPCIYFSATPLFVVFTVFLSVVAAYEMLKANDLHRNAALSVPMYLIALVPAMARYIDKTDFYRIVFPYIFVCSFLVISVYTFMKSKPELGKVITSWFFSMYATVGFTALVLLADIKDGSWHIMFFAFIASWVTDSCALIFGMLLGKHKLLPSVSPKKTVEGAIGGVACCVIAFYLYAKLLESFLDFQMDSYLLIALCGLICGIVAVIGDLIFSAVKRASGIKDFGKLIPGHGGVLDRFDSLISIAIVLLMFISSTNIF